MDTVLGSNANKLVVELIFLKLMRYLVKILEKICPYSILHKPKRCTHPKNPPHTEDMAPEHRPNNVLALRPKISETSTHEFTGQALKISEETVVIIQTLNLNFVDFEDLISKNGVFKRKYIYQFMSQYRSNKKEKRKISINLQYHES